MMRKRLDYFIVWKNGFDFIFEILDEINESNFEIFNIKKIKTKYLKKFIKLIYSHDYAPLIHLKGKLSYLHKIKNDYVYLISVYNNDPKEFLQFSNKNYHVESESMNMVKRTLRNKYNEIDHEGNLTHNHIIHGTDNQNQAFFLLNKFNIKIPEYDTLKSIWPSHLENKKDFILKKVKIEDLKASLVFEKKIIKQSIDNTPHFKFLNGSEKSYIDYLKENLGGLILRYHSPKKFKNLYNNVIGLKSYQDFNPIILNQNGLILDGLHRVSIQKKIGNKEIPAIIVNNE